MDYDLIFDNTGGIILQTEDYCHYYANAAEAVKDILELHYTDNPRKYWDGNEPELRQKYDSEVESNGGYRWVPSNDVEYVLTTVLKSDARKAHLKDLGGWSNLKEFWLELFQKSLGLRGCWDSNEGTIPDYIKVIAQNTNVDTSIVADIIWNTWCSPSFQVEPYDEMLGDQEWIDYCEYVEEVCQLANGKRIETNIQALETNIQALEVFNIITKAKL